MITDSIRDYQPKLPKNTSKRFRKLCSSWLWQDGFFSKAEFYGGTALRKFYYEQGSWNC